MPAVSIIIPVYNAEKYLARCLDSVCNQTLKDIEIICVNDCSADSSLSILKEYQKNYQNLKIIDCKKNQGESAARNRGLENANGEYIAFVDNDDTVDLNFYEKLYTAAKLNNADISKGEVHIIDYSGTEFYGDLNIKIHNNNSILFFAYYWWTAIYKHSLIKENNIKFLEGYPLGGDILFLNEIVLKIKKYALTDSVFYNYYKRADSGDSKILSSEKIHSALNIYRKILNNINSTKTISDKKGVLFIQQWILESALNFIYRNNSLEILEHCIKTAFEFYNRMENKSLLLKEMESSSICEVEFFLNNDSQGLIDFYKKNNTPAKLFCAKLRKKNLANIGTKL